MKDTKFIYHTSIRTFFWVDKNFYESKKSAIVDWSRQYNCKMPSIKLGWVQCPDEETATLFVLKWS